MNHATPADRYIYRPPSPPRISVPNTGEGDLVLPAYEGIDGEDITYEDLKIITQGHHSASDNTVTWQYEWRRKAQMILPFLYLGPGPVAKDKEFLQSVGITMLLVVRDTHTARAGLMSGAKMAAELGIEATSVDTGSLQELISAFPRAVGIINDHLLSVFRKQRMHNNDAQNGITINPSSFKPGKVLVYCESGNERSAAVVAAYLMTVYGLGVVGAVQFIQSQRFCVVFDEPLKNVLLAYKDIVQATKDVSKARHAQAVGEMVIQPTPSAFAFSDTAQAVTKQKRSIGEYAAEDEDMSGDLDGGRFEGRQSWAPFVGNPDV
jgi:serine/threonine/tyrosine-interacting protein